MSTRECDRKRKHLWGKEKLGTSSRGWLDEWLGVRGVEKEAKEGTGDVGKGELPAVMGSRRK